MAVDFEKFHEPKEEASCDSGVLFGRDYCCHCRARMWHKSMGRRRKWPASMGRHICSRGQRREVKKEPNQPPCQRGEISPSNMKNASALLLLCFGLVGCSGFFSAPKESEMQRLQASPAQESDWLASRTDHYRRSGLPKDQATQQAERDLRSPAGTSSSPVPIAPKK
jgi:hypothetical protein